MHKKNKLQSIESDDSETVAQPTVSIDYKSPIDTPSITQNITQPEALRRPKSPELYASDIKSINVKAEKTSVSLSSFLKKNALEYWITILVTSVSLLVVFTLKGAALSYFRGSAGLLLALWLPGYSLVKALFPPKTVQFERQSSSGWLLTASFSIVFSIIIVSLAGFALDFSPWGVNLESLTLNLFFLTIIFASIAMLRRYSLKKIVNKAEQYVK